MKKSLAAFNVPTVATTILLDGIAYDGFPALAALEDTCPSNPSKCHSAMTLFCDTVAFFDFQ